MAKSKRVNIRQLSNGKWQVDWGRNYPKVKDPRPEKKGRMVGRRSQHANKKAAESYAAEVIAEVDNGKALSLTTTERIEWHDARKAMDEAGFTNVSISDAVKQWLKLQPKQTYKLGEVFDQWEADGKAKVEANQRSKRHTEDIRKAKKTLLPFWSELIHEVAEKTHEIVEFVDTSWPVEQTRKNHLTKAGQFFNWAVERDFVTKNPIKTTKSKPKARTPHVYNLVETRRILQAAHRTDQELGLLAYYTIALFAGCRPSEIGRLQWSDIHTDDEEPRISLPASSTGKNKTPRKIPLDDNALQWLALCDRNKSIKPNGFQKRRIKLLTEAEVYSENGSKVEKTKHQDATRHTFGTYLYAKTEDIETVTFRMGNSSKVFLDHYRGAAPTKREAAEYFGIQPQTDGSKLIKFAG